jgi:acetolactate synthase I/III small subunit
MQHTLSVLVENKPGVLTRVASLFARRGFNIDSLAVGVTEDPTLSRITIVVGGNDTTLEQVAKQLHKLINVIKIQDLDPKEMVDRELVLFKVNAPADRRHEIIEVANVFRAKIVDVGKNTLTIEATGNDDKLGAMEDLLRAYGIKELARTGKIALSRGSREAATASTAEKA